MRKWSRYFKWGYGIFVCAMLLSGCSGERSTEERIAAGGGKEEAEEREEEKAKQQEEKSDSAAFMEEDIEDTEDIEDAKVTEHTENENEDTAAEPEIVYADWSAYFNGLNGTAVVYDASDRRYTIYKEELAVEPEQDDADLSIYGKTGMGKADGIVVDAWFTGFAESAEGKLYFCVRLGRTDGMNVSSSLAKESAIRIVSDYDR